MSSEILSNWSRSRDRPVGNKRLQSQIDSISITILFIASITHHQAEYRCQQPGTDRITDTVRAQKLPSWPVKRV